MTVAGTEEVVAGAAIVWTAETEVEGEVVFRLGRAGAAYVAEWPGCLRVTSNDGQVAEVVAPDADVARLHKLRRGAVRGLLRQLEGKLSFHGSAVSTPHGCVAFLGCSGAGKSTLAAAFLHGAHAVAGATLVSDDVVHVDATNDLHQLLPGEESHLLDAASCAALRLVVDPTREKTAVSARQATQATPLDAVVVLQWGADLNVQRPQGTFLLSALLTHVARLVVDDAALLLAELERLKRLVRQVPVYVVTRPKQFAALPELMTALSPLFASEHSR
jgi:hypothetical protein